MNLKTNKVAIVDNKVPVKLIKKAVPKPVLKSATIKTFNTLKSTKSFLSKQNKTINPIQFANPIFTPGSGKGNGTRDSK